MNLFWKKLFGGMKSAEVLEAKFNDQTAAYVRYKQVAQSAELAEYMTLRDIVSSTSFKENKKKLQKRKYKDTDEYRSMKSYQKLQNNPAFKQFLHIQQSPELLDFLAFKKTPDYKKLADKAAVKADATLQKWANFEKSKAYKNYVRFNGTAKANEYQQLQNLVTTSEFKTRNAFWQNEKRWETTNEAQQDKRFSELAKNPDIVFYLSSKKDDFAAFERYEEVFTDNFDGNTLSAERWQPGFHYGSTKLKSIHSFVSEQQANNGGRNVSVSGGAMHLTTRQEHVKAAAWDVKKGFVEKEFDYTSDVVTSGAAFVQKGGVFMAKMRCTGAIHHAFWLGANRMLPHINIFHFNGKRVTMGNASASMMDEAVVKGLQPSEYYIYSLLWTDRELVWYVNNVEVFRTTANVPNEKMYLAFSSFISQAQQATSGSLDVEWVKVYKVK